MFTRLAASIIFAGVIAGVGAVAGTAGAQTSATGNLRVQATVLSSCSVQDSTLDYGAISPTQLQGQRPQTDIRVLCTAGVPYTVGINNGSNASGTQRRMLRSGGDGTRTTDYLNYELFQGLTGTVRWGDAIVTERVSGTGSGSTQAIPVYGGLVQSEVSTGNYVDNAVITLRY